MNKKTYIITRHGTKVSGEGNPPVKIRMYSVEFSGGSPSPCSASRGMTWKRNYYIFRNKDIINTSSHICTSGD